MEFQEFYNVLEGFNFDLLNNSDFKEDSVREEIVVPIIKGLGYTADKPNQIIRSKTLLHPFVSIGSQRQNIYIIPDYLLNVGGKPAWILDAKAPNEKIIKSKNVEQAYSYAIHNEIRVNFFALCNGKEFVLYDVQRIEPILHFPMKAIPLYWDNLKKFLSPKNVFSNNHYILAKDMGLHLKRLGFDKFNSLIFLQVPITDIVQLDPDMFSSSVCLELDNSSYVATFDFNENILDQLQDKIPLQAIQKLKIRTDKKRQAIKFSDRAYMVNIDCRVGEIMEENTDEIFLPLIINKIMD